ncbi:aminopeptidase [Natrarchaeobaculum sulfurireducens]|uniref:Leucyl aminopeptidase (Aminopeptidase T) n=1 Tax=Natrarchaeobaculum sulfurireducens TaxID=2044521 RepID=A0A346PJ84_9EURY|nr:aminopeptidase [Natrarchaeobaculum sulfurireducens]AXR79579.1 Leucyl aminopeptidase (aminopeptidase T) [Natrarchaeobaculum sulfurireducens]
MSELRAAAETAVEQCLALEADDSCVIVTDDEREPIGEALYAVAREITDDVAIVRYPPGDQHGEEPPETVATALAGADAFLAPTTKSLSHTRARSDATEAGARGATLPGITEDVFVAGLDADYGRILEECERTLERVAGADEIRVTTDRGTDITFDLGDREWFDDTGDVSKPGSFSNLPAGEVFISPESADGTFVVDGTMRPHGLLEEGQEIEFVVEDGLVTEISDDEIRQDVEAAAEECEAQSVSKRSGETAEQAGDAAYNLAELGIGTNVGVTELVGSVLLDEKAAGTVHIAIGDDAGIGGDVEAPIHQDGILREPTVYVDGDKLELPTAGH